MVISVNYGFGGGVTTVTNAESSAESEKFTLKIRSESGKLFTIGCHFPPKSTNFETPAGREGGQSDGGPAGRGVRQVTTDRMSGGGHVGLSRDYQPHS